ncbi:MAG: penicillin-binding protein 1C [Nonlabens sp.]
MHYKLLNSSKFISFLVKHKIKLSLLLIFGIWYYLCLPKQLFNVPYSTVIESSDGRLLDAHIASDEQWRFPAVDSVPYRYKQCVLQYEDAYFYSHPGFNPISIYNALSANIEAGKVVRGGSTITQQVIRLARKENRNYLEKLIELIWATRLELRSSKTEILDLYASHAPYGGNVVGLEMAAWRYFGRRPHELSWAESATLAVLPNAPGLIYPGKRQSQLKEKRNAVLLKLQKENIISPMQYELALLEEIPTKDFKVPQLAPHLLQRARVEYGNRKLITSIDYDLQQRLNTIVSNQHSHLRQNGVHNAALLVLDVENNSVAAYVGNTPTTTQHSKDVDIITAPRSTGSVLKPFLYASLLDEGLLLPHTLVKDIPTTIDGFSTENYSRTYQGAVPASQALARSLNVPAVRMLREYGVNKFYNRLQDLRLSHINRGPNTYGLSLIIGGGESSLWDISKAYLSMTRDLKSYIGNSSQYDHDDSKYFSYLKEVDRDIAFAKAEKDNKKTNLKNAHNHNWLQEPSIFNAASIYHTFEAMKTVNRPEGEEIWHFFNPENQIAWKTGTSYGNRDAWAVGVTPKYVIGVWAGNADGEGRANLTGIDSAAPILFDVFNLLPQTSWFERPYDDLIELEICKQSGFLAGMNCEKETQWIPVVGERTPPCPYHKIIHLDKTETYRVNADCESASQIISIPKLVLPPVMSYYYAKANPSYKNLPPYREDCTAPAEPVMRFINPTHGTTITLTKNKDGEINAAIFELAHINREKKIYWHIDEEFQEMTSGYHQLALLAEPGRHLITAVDEDGNDIKMYVNFE